MMSLLSFLLKSQLKRSQVVQIRGFTLIELLVAMIMAVLIITPLLGFMINILNTDRQEQAKATSEQEIQTALDYIARDLEQAIYIYDADGLTRNSNTDPTLSGIKDQIPPGSGATGGCSNSGNICQPILVFWKRNFIKDAIKVSTTSSATDNKDDTFVYSLVAYYLIKDNNATWSNAARISRFEISDGVPDVNGVVCSSDYPDEKYTKVDSNSDLCPDKGFKRFDLTAKGNNLKEKMNMWKKASTAYSPDASVALVDFIDQTQIPPATNKLDLCPPDKDEKGNNIFKLASDPQNMGFYACVDKNTTAQVLLRGNALARVQNDNINYTDNKKTYFPSASIRVQGRGYLFNR